MHAYEGNEFLKVNQIIAKEKQIRDRDLCNNGKVFIIKLLKCSSLIKIRNSNYVCL